MRSSAGGLISMTPCLKVTDTAIRCDIHGDSCGHLSMQSLVERQDEGHQGQSQPPLYIVG